MTHTEAADTAQTAAEQSTSGSHELDADPLPWWVGTSEEFMNIGGPYDNRDEAIGVGRDHQCGDQFWILQARQAAWSPPSAVSVINDMCDSADDLFYEDGFNGFDGTKVDEKAAEDDLLIDMARSAKKPEALAAPRAD